MQVVHLAEYRRQEVVAVLKGLLHLAEIGELHGVAFIGKFGQGKHRSGLAGDYRRHPDEALLSAVRLKQMLAADPPDQHEQTLS